MQNLMQGKRGLVMGIANDHSIAWGMAKTLHAHGAERERGEREQGGRRGVVAIQQAQLAVLRQVRDEREIGGEAVAAQEPADERLPDGARERRVEIALRVCVEVVAAVGVPGLITGDMVKPGATVVDVGITRVVGADGKGRYTGDVAADVADVAGANVPVPGGVGPMTRAMLLTNVVERAERS